MIWKQLKGKHPSPSGPEICKRNEYKETLLKKATERKLRTLD